MSFTTVIEKRVEGIPYVSHAVSKILRFAVRAQRAMENIVCLHPFFDIKGGRRLRCLAE